MGDQLNYTRSNGNSLVAGVATGKKSYQRNLVVSRAKGFPGSIHQYISSVSSKSIGDAAGHVAVFLLKLVALETVRRVSTAKCPFVWRGIQFLQILCYPPFKWIQKWSPFKDVGKGMQALSRPFLVLSIATAFSDQGELSNETSNAAGVSNSQSQAQSDTSTAEYTLDTRISDDNHHHVVSENWLVQLYKELENQGISLPERINEDELHRFYAAANGNFPYFLSLVKKTVRWRETYGILSLEELETWSSMIFWHGYDVKDRPCLIVRLGLACSNLLPHDRPRFAQAVVSQVEHGVLHLVGAENPEITVLVDCEGLSPLRIPMQLIRSCSMLLQDHFPNRLGCLFVIQLPPVVRVIGQTFIQMLKPVTRKKFKVEGESYHKILLDYLPTIPSYLGGDCECRICSSMSVQQKNQPYRKKKKKTMDTGADISNNEDALSSDTTSGDDREMNGNCDQLLRTAIVGILMIWVLVALIAGFLDPESRPF